MKLVFSWYNMAIDTLYALSFPKLKMLFCKTHLISNYGFFHIDKFIYYYEYN